MKQEYLGNENFDGVIHFCFSSVLELDIVAYFKRSAHALGKLVQYQQQNNLPIIKVVQDCPTRWNSTLDMVRRIIQLKDGIAHTTALLRVDCKDPELRTFYDNCKFTQEEVEILNELVHILTPFETITNEISGQKYVTCSKVLLFIKILYSKFNDSAVQHTKFLLEGMKKDFDNRFGTLFESNELLCQSTFLDPRFKRVGFREESKFLKTCTDLQRRVVALTASNEQPGNKTAASKPTESTLSDISDTFWKEFDEEVRLLTGGTTPAIAGIIETDRYKNEPLIHRNEDPIKYWVDRKNVYPGLFRMVLRRLHITGTSVPCEEMFSKMGAIITARRNRLKAKKLKELVFLKENKKFST